VRKEERTDGKKKMEERKATQTEAKKEMWVDGRAEGKGMGVFWSSQALFFQHSAAPEPTSIHILL
jgi:hypothetical protein